MWHMPRYGAPPDQFHLLLLLLLLLLPLLLLHTLSLHTRSTLFQTQLSTSLGR
jgi:hypothetical protein